MSRRGALIVLEGCDRVGKSTQCRKLVQALHKNGVDTEQYHFPDRSTCIGQQIDQYLTQKSDMNDRSIHLLFSANRWELESKMRESLLRGTTLIVDRYAYSGVAFTAAKKVASLDWCKGPDRGLPAPDVVFYLQLSSQVAQNRSNYGDERYEKTSFQDEAAEMFEQLLDPTWQRIDASTDIETIHKDIMAKVNVVMETASNTSIKELWT